MNPLTMRKLEPIGTSSTLERLRWRVELIQERISDLPTKYAESIIPMFVAISANWLPFLFLLFQFRFSGEGEEAVDVCEKWGACYVCVWNEGWAGNIAVGISKVGMRKGFGVIGLGLAQSTQPKS